MRLITWNVLHRVHAENWDERAVLAAYPDETLRTNRIVARISGWLADPEPTCVALQEVSGDVLAALRARLPGLVHAVAYPEMPRPRIAHATPLGDPSEHLVVVVAGGVAAPVPSSFTGSGLLAVRVAGLRVVTGHIDFDPKGDPQVARMVAAAGAGPVALCGDFNRSAERALALLGPRFTQASAEVTVHLPTREGIDHVFVRGVRAAPLTLGDRDPASDHPPVAARLYWGEPQAHATDAAAGPAADASTP